MTTIDEQIMKLEERYPFNKEELEILVRCHDHIKDNLDSDDFLMKMALASPYSFFFVPGDEMKNRVSFLEDYVLPMGFTSELRASLSMDFFVDYANQGQGKSLERFIEGVADTGRRGPKEALKVIYNMLGDDWTPKELIDVCYRLSVAADVVVAPNLNQDIVKRRLQNIDNDMAPLTRSLTAAMGDKPMSRQIFTDWAEEMLPMLSSPLSTFVHNILFHGQKYPSPRIPYTPPMPSHQSDIFTTNNSPLLTILSFASDKLGGKWHRLYSCEVNGRSFCQLEWSVLGYTGPSLMVIRTEEGAVLGAFAACPWKQSSDFYGTSDCFIIQVEPKVNVFRPTGKGNNFMFSHSGFMESLPIVDNTPNGIGFGGTKEKPRLFIPESLEHCTGAFMDGTFQFGPLLPETALDTFEIKFLEVWGVGGDQVIAQALRDRADYREQTDTTLRNARTVMDKSQFVADYKSGLIDNSLFDHQKQVRGRQDFRVDDEHGGYKIDRE